MHLSVHNNVIVKATCEDYQSEVTEDVIAVLQTIDDIFQRIINFNNRPADDEWHWQLSNLVWLNIN